MKFTDLLGLALDSLKQRFLRTAMTVLGVLIGTTSVVVMVSLGVGLSKSMMGSIQSNQAMTRVTVYGEGSGSMDPKKTMTDATIQTLKGIDGVKDVTPIYSVWADARVGGYNGDVELVGVPANYFTEENYELGQGRIPGRGDGFSAVVGSKVQYNFYDGSSKEPPEVDWLDAHMLVEFYSMSSADPSTSTAPPRKMMSVAGVLAGDDSSFNEENYGVFVEMDTLVRTLKQAMPGQALPGQPATMDGKPRGNTFVYSKLHITAESVERAEQLTKELREDGYSVQSNVEMMREIQNISRMIQAVFGGIGAVSLLVAAIGIANTMLMSMYERTKQIGIMKVLGAALNDIRNLFLIESAAIGFFGGVAGLLLSFIASFILNVTLGSGVAMTGGSGAISIIPIWLALAALLFSTLVGTLAGLVPAQRAMNLSPLAAIRAE